MKVSPHRIAAVALALALGATAHAQSSFILVPDSSADVIVKLSAVDGSILDAAFIADANDPLTYDFGTPKDVLQVNDEIWVIDQIADAIFRFDQNGAWIGTTATNLDNCRGGAFANGVVYISNDGSGNGASVDSVMMFNTSGAPMGSFSAANTGTSPFDVTEYNGELLVCHFTASNTIGRYDYTGNLLGPFHVSNGTTGIDSPEQMIVSAANTLLVTGFGAPIGIYEYDMSGTQINMFPNPVFLRGVAELGNGLLLITDSQGIKTYDRATMATVSILATSGGQFPGVFDFGGGGPMTYCTAKTTSSGCVPAIGFNGTPSPTGGFTVTCDMVEVDVIGILIYSTNGPAAAPFQGGFLCVQPPLVRMPVQNSRGTTVCTGSFDQPMAAVIASLATGTQVNAQYWFRDQADPFGSGLSNALEFVTLP